MVTLQKLVFTCQRGFVGESDRHVADLMNILPWDFTESTYRTAEKAPPSQRCCRGYRRKHSSRCYYCTDVATCTNLLENQPIFCRYKAKGLDSLEHQLSCSLVFI